MRARAPKLHKRDRAAKSRLEELAEQLDQLEREKKEVEDELQELAVECAAERVEQLWQETKKERKQIRQLLSRPVKSQCWIKTRAESNEESDFVVEFFLEDDEILSFSPHELDVSVLFNNDGPERDDFLQGYFLFLLRQLLTQLHGQLKKAGVDVIPLDHVLSTLLKE